MADAIDQVAAAIVAAPVLSDQGARNRWGTVVAVGTGTVDVDIGGTTVPGVIILRHYADAETGDRVLVSVQGGALVVIGAVA